MMASNEMTAVDAQTFRTTLAQWASGVTVVTTLHEGQRLGITASSFSSVSLTPPRILICVAKRLFTHQAVLSSGIFAVNILAADQQQVGMRFAGMLPEQEDRFAGLAMTTAQTGAPLLAGTLGWLDCRLSATHDGGDHSIFVGDVVAAWGQEDDAAPILYYHRRWRALAEA